MFLLKKDFLKKEEVSSRLEDMEFDEDNMSKYIVASIVNSAVFELDKDLYYQVH